MKKGELVMNKRILVLAVLIAFLSLASIVFAQEETNPIDVPEGFSLVDFISDTQVQAFEKAEDVLEPDSDYQAIIVTSKGTIVTDLFEADAPNTVNNFVFLALNHYYEGILFHRVLEDFMAQTGDPTGTGAGGPGYKFADEFSDKLHDGKGILSMANSGANTNGSQFFITFSATSHLDNRHTVFGKVIDGMDILDKLNRITPGQSPKVNITAYLDESLKSLREKGIDLSGPDEQSLESYCIEQLEAVPEIGESFEIDGAKAISGRIGTALAIGFYGGPDTIEKVYIIKADETN